MGKAKSEKEVEVKEKRSYKKRLPSDYKVGVIRLSNENEINMVSSSGLFYYVSGDGEITFYNYLDKKKSKKFKDFASFEKYVNKEFGGE